MILFLLHFFFFTLIFSPALLTVQAEMFGIPIYPWMVYFATVAFLFTMLLLFQTKNFNYFDLFWRLSCWDGIYHYYCTSIVYTCISVLELHYFCPAREKDVFLFGHIIESVSLFPSFLFTRLSSGKQKNLLIVTPLALFGSQKLQTQEDNARSNETTVHWNSCAELSVQYSPLRVLSVHRVCSVEL